LFFDRLPSASQEDDGENENEKENGKKRLF